MTNIPYEERIKNRSNDWYYNKCIQQYYFIISSQYANERYKEEIKRLTKAKETMENEYDDLLKIFCKLTTEYKKETTQLNKIIERLVNYNELVYKRYDRKIKDYPIRSIVKHNLEIIKELKKEGK